MHSNGKGISDSALPFKRTQSSWLKTSAEEVTKSSAFGGHVRGRQRERGGHGTSSLAAPLPPPPCFPSPSPASSS